MENGFVLKLWSIYDSLDNRMLTGMARAWPDMKKGFTFYGQNQISRQENLRYELDSNFLQCYN